MHSSHPRLHRQPWLNTPGEMSLRIREFPWHATPLGPIDRWSIWLRNAVEMMLSCGFPTTLQWGPEAILLYNDPYVELIGARHPSALGKSIFASFPEIREAYQPLFLRVRGGETVVLEDMPYRYERDGKLTDTWFNLSYSPVRDENGAIVGVMAIGFETTSRVALQQSQEALRQTEKLAVVGRLASSIAHEINNPLEAVTNLVYLARHSNVAAETASLLDQADKELRRVSLVTRETLRFHRQHSQPSHTDLAEVLDAILLLHESRLLQAQITTQRRYRPHPTVMCRHDEIRQVIANLITNAVEAMSSNSPLRVLNLRIRPARDWKTGYEGVILMVCDTGMGMSTTAKARAFEPFFTTKEATNSGLGLWISREIVEKHRGRLTFRSRQSAAMRGTIFTLFLPVEPAG